MVGAVLLLGGSGKLSLEYMASSRWWLTTAPFERAGRPYEVRFVRDGKFRGFAEGEGMAEISGRYRIVDGGTLDLDYARYSAYDLMDHITGKMGPPPPAVKKTRCRFVYPSGHYLHGSLLKCENSFHLYNRDDPVPPGTGVMIGDVPAVTMGGREGVTRDHVRIRAAPDVKAARIHYYSEEFCQKRLPALPPGKIILILARTRDKRRVGSLEDYWYYADDRDGGGWEGCRKERFGWVFGAYVRLL